MKPVIISSPSNKESLRKALLAKKYPIPILVRMGSDIGVEASKYTVQINSRTSILRTTDKIEMKSRLRNYGIKTLQCYTSQDIGPSYPCMVKSRYKNKGRASVYYVDNKSDLIIAIQLCNKAYYIEPIFTSTSEYRLFCTKEEVFLTIKKLKQDPEDIILSKNNTTNVRVLKEGSIKFPKLWSSMQKNALSAINVLGLDIASVDIGYSSVGDHDFTIHKVNCNPSLPPNILSVYVEQIDKIIKTKAK